MTAASAADDTGLFGSQDPTYDGVYRQGLAITGLAAVERRVPAASVRWLLTQQCGNGSFMSYRGDLTQKCAKPDPTNFTGEDTNATALAAMALTAVGRPAEARSAIKYLFKVQNPDGGFPYFAGESSDSNSTGLVLAAMGGHRLNAAHRDQAKQARKYLRTVQLGCAVASKDRGLLQYQGGIGTSDVLGSAQGALGQVTTLPPNQRKTTGTALTCRNGSPVAGTNGLPGLLHALARGLSSNQGLLPSSFGSGPDISASATAAMTLAAAEYKQRVVTKAVKALKKNTTGYVTTDGQTNAGATGTLLLTAGATGANPTRFGGVNLVSSLKASRR
jgi:hypothetical protein